MKLTKRIFGLASGILLLASCGGHTMCDAYSYMEYKKVDTQKNIILENTDLETSEES